MPNGDELKKLYQVVSGEGLYTKSFDEFKQKYSDSASIDKLYNVVSGEGLYTKDKNSFYQKYYPTIGEVQQPAAQFANAQKPTGQISTQQVLQAQQGFQNAKTTSTEQQNVSNYGKVAGDVMTNTKGQYSRDEINNAAINTATNYFKSNPVLLQGLNKDKSISLKNIPTKEDEYSLKNLKNISLFDKKVAEVKTAFENGDLALTKFQNGDKTGEPVFTRSSGFLRGIGQGIEHSLGQTKDAVVNMVNDDKSFADYLDNQVENLPEIPEEAPGGLANTIGTQVGGLIKPMTEFGLGTGVTSESGGWGGFAALAADMIPSTTTAKTKELYYQRMSELKQQYGDNIPEEERLNAIKSAKSDATLQAIPEEAMQLYLFSRAGGALGESKGVQAFKNTLYKSGVDITKMAGLGGASEAVTQGIKNLQGYNTDDAEKRIGQAVQDWATIETAFKALHIAGNVPNYFKSGAKEALANIDPQVVDKLSEERIKSGQSTPEQEQAFKDDLNDYKKARAKVGDSVPEEDIPSYAGLQQKRDNLIKQRKESESISDDDISPEIKQNKIDIINAQIKDVDSKIAEMNKSDKPAIDHEIDNLTGEKINEQSNSNATEGQEAGNTTGISGSDESGGGVSAAGEAKNELPKEKTVAPKEVDFTAKGGNKVVDDKGEPKQMYHQTNADFNEFDNSKKGTGQGNDFGGIWFSDNDKYFSEDKKNVKQANIVIKNPATDADLKAAQEQLPENLYNDKKGKSEWYENYFKEKGFDGIILKNGEHAVFDKSQINLTEQSKPTEPQPQQVGSEGNSALKRWNSRYTDEYKNEPEFEWEESGGNKYKAKVRHLHDGSREIEIFNQNLDNKFGGQIIKVSKDFTGTDTEAIYKHFAPDGKIKTIEKSQQQGNSAEQQPSTVIGDEQKVTPSEKVIPEQQSEKEIKVTPFKKGDGGTRGVFQDKDGNLYKSLDAQMNTFKDGKFQKVSAGLTKEHELLSELQDNPHIPKVGKVVDTSEGKAFEIEKLNEVDRFTKEEYRQIQGILNDLNEKGYHVADRVTVMRRPKTNELVVVDFSSGYKMEPGSSGASVDAKDYMQNIKAKLSPEDKKSIEHEDAAEYRKAMDEFENRFKNRNKQPEPTPQDEPTISKNKLRQERLTKVDNALKNDPESAHEAMLQYFLMGGKVGKDQYVRASGFGGKKGLKEAFGKRWALADKGDPIYKFQRRKNKQGKWVVEKIKVGVENPKSIDTFAEELAHQFGGDPMDYHQQIVDLITDHTKDQMRDKLMELRGGEKGTGEDSGFEEGMYQHLSEDEAKEMDDIMTEKLKDYVEGLPEATQQELLNLLKNYQDKYGFINFDKLKEDSEGFTPELLNLSDEATNRINEILNEHERRKETDTAGEGNTGGTTAENDKGKEARYKWAEANEERLNEIAEQAKDEADFNRLIDEEIAKGGVVEDSGQSGGTYKTTTGTVQKEGFDNTKYRSWNVNGHEYGYADIKTSDGETYAVRVKVNPKGDKEWQRISNDHLRAAQRYDEYAKGEPYKGREKQFNKEFDARKQEFEKHEKVSAEQETKAVPDGRGNIVDGGRGTSTVQEGEHKYGNAYDRALQKVKAKQSESNKETPDQKVKTAQSAYDKAQADLKKAEDRISQEQAKQNDMFAGGAQKGMFGMGRDEAKDILDPLRKKVKETKAELDKALKEKEVAEEKSGDLFEDDGVDAVRMKPKEKTPPKEKEETQDDNNENATGVFKENTERKESKDQRLKPVDLPELIQFAKRLANGKLPELKKIKDKLGYFSSAIKNIVLNKDLFKQENYEDLVKTIAHEIGHFASYLGDTLKGTNILGKLASIKDFMEDYLPFKPGDLGPLTAAERKRIAKDVENTAKQPRLVDEVIEKKLGLTPQDVLDVWNSVDAGRNNPDLLTFIQGLSDTEKKSIVVQAMKGMLSDKLNHLIKTIKEKTGKQITVWDTPDKQALKQMIDEAIQKEVKKRKLWNDKEVFDEAYKLSKEWRPFDENTASPSELKYRKKPEEVYADMVSILFNSPGTLEEKAPKFFQAFMNYLDSKPEFKAVYEDTMKLLENPDAVLEERNKNIEEGYEAGRKKRAENIKLEQDNETRWQKAKREYFSVVYPLLRVIPDTKDPSGGLTAREQVRNQLEKWQMWKSKTHLFLDNTQRNIDTPLKEAGISTDDIGKLVQFNRGFGKARIDKANPGGIQGEANVKGYLKVMDKYTPEQQKLIEEKLNEFYEKNHDVMKDAYDAGIISDDLWKEVQDNKFNYATFKPIDFIDGMIHGADFKKIEGTIRDIENPYTSTIAKMVVVQRAAETNKAKTAVIKSLKIHDPSNIRETKQTITGKTTDKVGDNEDVIKVKEKGENKYYIVDKHIAHIFNNTEPNEMSTAIQIAHKITQPLKDFWTTLAPNFAFISNPIRDAKRTLRGMYSINAANNSLKWHDIITSGVKYPVKYIKNLKGAASLMAHNPTELVSRMLEYNAMNPESAIFENYNPELSGMANIFSHYKFMADHLGITEPQAKKGLAKGYDNLIKGFNWITSPLRYAGKATEFSGKITAFEMLEKRLGTEKAAYYTRNFTGTPNFSERTAADYSVIPFAKVILQGLRNEADLATNKRTAGAYWLAHAVYTVLPAVLSGMAMKGYFDNDKDKEGQKLSDIYKKAGKYQRNNSTIIPLGHDEKTGDAKFLAIPLDEASLVVHQNIMNLFEDESGLQHARDVLGSATNLLPSASSFDLYKNLIIAAAGQNPHDSYYDRDIITDRHFKEGGWAAAKDMLKYTVNNIKPFGINIPYYDESPSKRTPKGNMVSAIPLLNKLYKQTSIGNYEELKKLKAQDDKEHALKSDKIEDAVMKATKDAAGETLQTGKYNAAKILTDAWKNYSGKEKPETKEDIVAYQQLKSVVLLSLKADKVQSVPQALSILNAGTNTLKKKYLDLYKKNMSEAEYNNLIKLLQQSGVTLPK